MVESSKFLGVITLFDWSGVISLVNGKVSESIGILKKFEIKINRNYCQHNTFQSSKPMKVL